MKRHASWMINDLAYFDTTASMGLGVFAAKNIAANQEILTDPVRSFFDNDAKAIRTTEAYHLFFVDREKYSTTEGSPLHLVVGAISIVNHNRVANCSVRWNTGPNIIEPKASLVAHRPITAGEELFISYHNIEEYDFD